uniref:Putative ovule protein n=1 Tax=Solanum chacoense TaxID=4108 RepID=A0A0V0IFA0_SOLCH
MKLLIRASLPPIERYCLCQVACLFSIFYTTTVHIQVDFNFSPRGRPSQVVGKDLTLQHIMSASTWISISVNCFLFVW